jgi:hypothetical protein
MNTTTAREKPVSIRFRGQRPTVALAARLANVPVSTYVREAALRVALTDLEQACGITSDAA